ncbi:MAG: shikimate kinase [Verrucomicrobiae bacterium]|nr:shikimate kinase [Verrucomicrobiae bacterium]
MEAASRSRKDEVAEESVGRPRNVVLIGFMGTGKSSVGRRVADSLGFEFVDTDHIVTELAGKSIPRIFADDGEERFREWESEALRRCATREGQVIATGGGIVTQPRNHDLLCRAGYVIWLKAAPEIVLRRVARNQERPLLQTEDPLSTIRELLESRLELYRACAQEEVNTTDLTLEETAHGITESARVALGLD